jgi:mannitol-specific phosphotransferase system IIBC component
MFYYLTGGTLLTIFATIQQEDILKTIIMAAIGAVVSFSVSLLMKALVKRWKQ